MCILKRKHILPIATTANHIVMCVRYSQHYYNDYNSDVYFELAIAQVDTNIFYDFHVCRNGYCTSKKVRPSIKQVFIEILLKTLSIYETIFIFIYFHTQTESLLGGLVKFVLILSLVMFV